MYLARLQPVQIIAASSVQPLEDIFTSFWAAVDARVLNSLDRVAASTTFLSSLLECLVFLVRRVLIASPEEARSLLHGNIGDTVANVESAVKSILQEQTKRTWEELSSGRLKVEGKDAGGELAKTLGTLHKLRTGKCLLD